MASLAGAPAARTDRDGRFFRWCAVLMALVIVCGFSVQLAMGRSSFSAPLLVHMHAVVFMGWVAIYVAQTALATGGSLALHRRLGWLGVAWLLPMLVLGTAITVFVVQHARTPFFFRPAHFLVANPLTLFGFVGLTLAAVALRRRTDWHRRLHLSGTALIMGPGFGRLLPAPLMQPWAFEICAAFGLLFPLAGALLDWRRRGEVHPAYRIGLGVAVALLLAGHVIGNSALGVAIHDGVVAGTAGEGVPALAFGAPPPGM